LHEQVLQFVKTAKPGGYLLEVGSYDVNGSVRQVVDVSIGIDIREGPGVDLVLDANDLVEHFGEGAFDSIVSAEMLEHCENWRGAINNMWGVLKDGGMLVLTACAPGKGRHDYPADYWRFTPKDLAKIFGDNTVITHPLRISSGVVAVKQGALPNLDEIEVMAI
jgi:O-antigen biosynthesis protein